MIDNSLKSKPSGARHAEWSPEAIFAEGRNRSVHPLYNPAPFDCEAGKEHLAPALRVPSSTIV
jgi:hypothetical protein